MPMSSGCTARAEMGVGFMIIFSGAALMFVKTVNPMRAVGAFTGALGVLAIALPAYMTGMCAVASHSCRTTTEPTLILTGLATVAVGVGKVLIRQKWKTDLRCASGIRSGAPLSIPSLLSEEHSHAP